MVSCCVKQCGARKNKNQPQLTLHRFPVNEILKKKWLESIGAENINPRHKTWYVCSMHFDETCFNKTLDVTRLRDGAVPSFSLMIPDKTRKPTLLQKQNIPESSCPMEVELSGDNLNKNAVLVKIPDKTSQHNILLETKNIPESSSPMGVELTGDNLNKNAILLKIPDKISKHILHETHYTSELSGDDLNKNKLPTPDETRKSVLHETQSTPESTYPRELEMSNDNLIKNELFVTIQQKNEKINIFTNKYNLLKKKVRSLNEKVRRRDGKIALASDIINDLKKGRFMSNEETLILEECAGPKDFLKRQIAKSMGLPLEKKYSEELRKFALTLHFFSPKAYDFIRKTYNTCLPHSRTLSKWYQHVDAEPGFTKEAFDALRLKVKESVHPVICALTLDEMAIRKCLTWDPKVQKFYGRVDCGHDINSDSMDEASQSLVIMVTSINSSWKLPIGYFLIVSLTGEQKALLVRTAIQLCQDAGVIVVSITCDGLAGNFSMFTSLGCNVLDYHTATNLRSHDIPVHVFIDPCHAIKLIRNAFGEMRVFVDPMGREINFKYLELLLDMQKQKGLHLATKLGKAHILFEKQKMKVKLATQLFSSSVADALEFCCNKLKLKGFKDCSGTVNFINIMNDIFDVLNSHSIHPPGWKKAMCPQNIGFIRAFFQSAIDYIQKLKLPSGQLLVQSRRKTGFVGLIIDMKSALALYEHLVEDTQVLKYIPLYKCSQDHLELFFSSIRARGGFNNNPNAVQFRAAYKKLLIRAEIREGGVGNCIPLEQINILTCSSKNPVNSINQLTQRNNFVEISEDESDLYGSYVEYLETNNLDEYINSVLEYIAGFVTRKLSREIKCDICLSLLIGEENLDSLIFQKSRGGLQYASDRVVDIIKKTENLIKPHLTNQRKPENYYLYILKFLTEYFDIEKVFYLPLNIEHNINHRMLLIKSIIKAYIDLRFRHHSKQITDRVSFRNHYNKLILFRNE